MQLASLEHTIFQRILDPFDIVSYYNRSRLLGHTVFKTKEGTLNVFKVQLEVDEAS